MTTPGANGASVPANAVLVCGLGRLGQRCVVLLNELGIPVFGLDDQEPKHWLTPGLPDLLDWFSVGDCRHHTVLKEAHVESCRAILLVTGNDRANISAALTARSLNPSIRLVIRSSQVHLNQLLDQSLGNVVALDPSELPATAFSLAALGDETAGLFSLDGQLLQVIQSRISPEHRWCEVRRLHELNSSRRRVLNASDGPFVFHAWLPDELVRSGDSITCIEFADRFDAAPASTENKTGWLVSASPGRFWRALVHFWAHRSQTQTIAIAVGVVLLTLYLAGAILYKNIYPEIGLLDAINIATVLIFDGYSNMFAQLKLPFPISGWLLAYSLLLTMAGTLVTGMLYAFLTGKVLSTRLHLPRRQGRVPKSQHVVVVGLDKLGLRVVNLLRGLHLSAVAVSATEVGPDALPGVPVIVGSPLDCLSRANCASARGLIVLTDDDVGNLEIALTARRINPSAHLVIRTDDPEFARNVSSLVPRAAAMGIFTLSAEAFAAAALGERVLGLLRIRERTILVVEYLLEKGDTLDRRLIAEVAYGYRVVPILHQRGKGRPPEFFPSEDIRLQEEDRLVVLASRDGLQNVEHGVWAPRDSRVFVHRALTEDAAFEAARTVARVTGCDLGTARARMSQLPGLLDVPLYPHQAARLVRELARVSVDAAVSPIAPATEP